MPSSYNCKKTKVAFNETENEKSPDSVDKTSAFETEFMNAENYEKLPLDTSHKEADQ